MSTQPQPAPVMAWHLRAADDVMALNYPPGDARTNVAKCVATHDPHAETVRLLENAIEHMEGFESGEDARDLTAWEQQLCRRSRDHLAKLKGPQ